MKRLLPMCIGSVAMIGGIFAADDAMPAPTTITTLSGKTYRGVQVLKAYPNGLAFRHSNGAAQILFTDLPEELQKQFQYTPEAAQAYEKEHLEAERLAAEKAVIVRAERRKKQDEVKLAALQLAMLREQSAAAANGYAVGGYADYGVPTWGYGYGADYAFPPLLDQGWGGGGLGPDHDRGHGQGHAHRAAINNLFYNYNTTKYIGPYSALYSGALTNSNVRPVLTFGGYRYPTAIAAPANVAGSRFNRHHSDPRVNPQIANPRPGGARHMGGGGRPVFVPANSAGARIGGTGGLMRVGSPRISHQ